MAGVAPAARLTVHTQDGMGEVGYIRLYIAGLTPNSLRAQHNLRDAINAIQDSAARLRVEVIDVFQGPKRAIADGILVTPTLVAQYCGKRAMMVGDLSDGAAVRSLLEACASDPGPDGAAPG